MRELVRGMSIDWGVSIRGACGALRFDTSTFHYKSRRTTRRPSKDGSRRSQKHVCATATGACTCCYDGKAGYQHEEDPQDLQRVRPAAPEQAPEAAGEGEAARRPPGSDWAERRLGDGLRPRPARPWQEAPHPDHCQHPFPPLPDRRSAVHLPWRRRGPDPRTGLWTVGYPKTIRVDNGSEFISRDLDLWAYANDVTLDFSRPGKPTDNGFIEAFNSKLRAECLNAHWFMSLADAREKLEDWRRDYNEVEPPSAIGYNVPIALRYPDGATSPSS